MEKSSVPEIESNPRASSFNKAAWAVFALALALYAALRLWHLTDSCLWFDEIFSVHAARHDWLDMIGFVAADIIHPPLFYLLLKAWIAIGGESLLWLRLFPALMAIATVLPLFLLCRKLNLGSAEINLTLLLMAVNGHLIKYAQELRMYSLLLFLALWSFFFFIRSFRSETPAKKFPVGLCVFNLLLIYTHYYGWMVVGVELICVLIWNRQKLRFCSAMVAVLIVSFSPWLSSGLRHAQRAALRTPHQLRAALSALVFTLCITAAAGCPDTFIHVACRKTFAHKGYRTERATKDFLLAFHRFISADCNCIHRQPNAAAVYLGHAPFDYYRRAAFNSFSYFFAPTASAVAESHAAFLDRILGRSRRSGFAPWKPRNLFMVRVGAVDSRND